MEDDRQLDWALRQHQLSRSGCAGRARLKSSRSRRLTDDALALAALRNWTTMPLIPPFVAADERLIQVSGSGPVDQCKASQSMAGDLGIARSLNERGASRVCGLPVHVSLLPVSRSVALLGSRCRDILSQGRKDSP